jgi:hypothetical protein
MTHWGCAVTGMHPGSHPPNANVGCDTSVSTRSPSNDLFSDAHWKITGDASVWGVGSCLAVHSDAAYVCTETSSIALGVLRAKSDAGAINALRSQIDDLVLFMRASARAEMPLFCGIWRLARNSLRRSTGTTAPGVAHACGDRANIVMNGYLGTQIPFSELYPSDRGTPHRRSLCSQ